jgi:putative ABC transport system permease protein
MLLVPAVKAQVASVDPSQPIYAVKPLERVISESTIGLAYVAAMMGVFGAIALVLASVGIYGMMAFSVAERRHEIGVRMALGAGEREIMRMVLARGALLTGMGVVAGLPLALLLAHVLASLLFGVSASDAAIFGGLTFTLVAIALLACYIPGRRALRISPTTALRAQ